MVDGLYVVLFFKRKEKMWICDKKKGIRLMIKEKKSLGLGMLIDLNRRLWIGLFRIVLRVMEEDLFDGLLWGILEWRRGWWIIEKDWIVSLLIY